MFIAHYDWLDANDDGRFDASDAIVILACLFLGDPCPTCDDAADADDTGSMEMNDAIYLLDWRFLSAAPPEPPFPDCGRDTTEDGLPDCSFSSCP